MSLAVNLLSLQRRRSVENRVNLVKVLLLAVCFGAAFSLSCAPRYACKDKLTGLGVKCETITQVYEENMTGASPPQPVSAQGKEKEESKKEKAKEAKKLEPPPTEASEAVKALGYDESKPVRLAPRVIRIWIAPWEDGDGDLHQSSYIYSEISPKRGRWLFGEKEIGTGQPVLRPMEKKEGEQMNLTPPDQTGTPQRSTREKPPPYQLRERSNPLFR